MELDTLGHLHLALISQGGTEVTTVTVGAGGGVEMVEVGGGV